MEITVLEGNRLMVTGTRLPGVIIGPKSGDKLIEYNADSYKQLLTMLITTYGKEVAEDILMTALYSPKVAPIVLV
jgi:hypothetical protein